jgi:signal transduction histidine kinase
MPFADADPSTGGMILGGAALALVVLDRAVDLWSKYRKENAEVAEARAAAAVAEADADDRVSDQWRHLARDLRTEVRAVRGELEKVHGLLRDVRAEHDECRRELAGIKRQNAGQQKQLDKITSVVGLPPDDGSVPAPALTESPPKG